MSRETLEDYFRRLNLDETRKFLENIKQGKHEEDGIDEHYLNVNRKGYSPIAPNWYSYMKRFTVQHRQRRAPVTSYR